MQANFKQIKHLLVIALPVLCIVPAIAQHRLYPAKKHTRTGMSSQLNEFYRLASDANVKFVFPKGFKEVKAPDNEDYSFDYAMELPGKDLEIWLQVKSQKENWASYAHLPNAHLSNPDSVYNALGAAQAAEFAGDKKYFVRVIPPDVLARYNADAGKSYLLTLPDQPETKHFKYALLITLQKNHTGTILALCFTNDKGPEFYKNMSLAGSCVKFKS